MASRPTTPRLDVRAVSDSAVASTSAFGGLRSSPDPQASTSTSRPSTPTLRRPSHSGAHLGLGTPPLRRAASFSSSARVVGLGLVDGSAEDDSTACLPVINTEAIPDMPSSTLATTALLLSPTCPSPDTFSAPAWASTSSNIVPTSVASRSPRSSVYLDPPATTSARRSSLTGHSAHSSTGSSASFHSAVSIRMDGEADPPLSASQRNGHGGNYWMATADVDSTPSAVADKEAERCEKRSKLASSGGAPSHRSILHFLLGPFAALLLPSSGDAPSSKRALPTRLLNAAYVIFSLLYLTSRLLAPYTPEAPPLRLLKRGVPAVDTPNMLRPRQWGPPELTSNGKAAVVSPLSPMRHTHRFSKMHSKVDGSVHANISPFTFRATGLEGRGDVTACLYTNEAWLSELPEFVRRWGGPISAVVELPYERTSTEFAKALTTLGKTRTAEPLIKQLVDFHVIANPPSSELQANRTRERLIASPQASNFQLNEARFFSRTSMVWLVGDARILPSPGLRKRLASESISRLVLERADAVVIPVFAALRKPEETAIPALGGGVGDVDFARTAERYVSAHRDSLPLPYDRWPKKKSTLVGLSSVHPPQSVTAPDEVSPPGPVFALWDRSWDANRGPSNWPLWRRSPSDSRLVDGPDIGGGAGLGIAGGVGGGAEPFRVADYDLHYAPAVVIGREQQPWCTERFGANKAACIYQMYLAGAEMWVVPDEWAFTLEAIDVRKEELPTGPLRDADKTQSSIASRLYTKFHQEACMHYGREFLSMEQWGSERATHLRATCAKVLGSWGVGLASD